MKRAFPSPPRVISRLCARWLAKFATALWPGSPGPAAPTSKPPSALWAGLAAAALGCVFAAMEQSERLKRWTPSPVALSLGLLLPFSSISVMFMGGIVGSLWLALHPASAKRYLIAVASGLIAGEAMVAVVAPVLIALHVGRG